MTSEGHALAFLRIGLYSLVKAFAALTFFAALLLVAYAWDPFVMRSYQPAGVNISSLVEYSAFRRLRNKPVLVRGIIIEKEGNYYIRNLDRTHELLLFHQDREGISECISDFQNFEVVLMGVFAGESELRRLFSIREIATTQEERRHCVNQEDYNLWYETDKI